MPKELYEVGPFRLDVGERSLTRGGEPVALQPKVFDTLVALVRRAGELVRKEELLAEVWPDAIVVESSLSQNVWLLRRALGEAQEGTAGYIETVPKAGYRFVAPVIRLEEQAPSLPPGPAVSEIPAQVPPPQAEPRPGRSAALWAVLPLLVLSALALTAVARYGARPADPARPADGPGRIAVAPLAFDNLSRDREVAWLATALPEMFAAELAAGGSLRLIPGDEVARAELETKTGGDRLSRIADHLGAEYLLTGSFLALGDPPGRRIRVDARLVEARTGEVVTRSTSTVAEPGLLDLVAESGARLRRSLRVAPASGEDAAAWTAALPVSLEARRLYFEGLGQMRALDPVSAQAVLARAVAVEPEFPLSHLALSLAWTGLGHDQRAHEEAKAALDRSAALSREAHLWIEAQHHRLAGDWDRAVDALQALYNFYPDQLEYGTQLCAALTYGGRPKEALEVVERLRRLPSPLAADPRIDLAEAHAALALGQPERLLALSDRVIAAGRGRGARFILVRGLTARGHALDDLGRLAEAKEAYREVQAIYESLGDRLSAARTISDLAIVAEREGDPKSAEQLFRRSLALYEAAGGGDRRGISSSLFNLGMLLSDRGDLAGGRACFERALALKREIGDRPGRARVLSAYAFNLQETGDAKTAFALYGEALAIRRELGDERGIVHTLLNLATLHGYRGDVGKATPLLEEAEAIARRNSMPSLLAAVQLDRGSELLLRGDLAGSRSRHEEALAIWQKERVEPKIAAGQASFAEVLRAAGATERAAAVAREAIGRLRAQKRTDDAAVAEATLGRCLVRQGQVTEARALLDRALAAVEKGHDLPARFIVSIAAADARAASGDLEGARRLLRATHDQAERVGFDAWTLEASYELARLDLAQGDPQAATRLATLAREADLRGMGLLAGEARAATGAALAAR